MLYSFLRLYINGLAELRLTCNPLYLTKGLRGLSSLICNYETYRFLAGGFFHKLRFKILLDKFDLFIVIGFIWIIFE